MPVKHLEILVEEPSMEMFLRVILPKILGDITFKVYPFLCKEDLLKRLCGRLKGYASWIPDEWRILVIVDRDDDDCFELKDKLERMASEASLVTRAQAHGNPYTVINRIAIEELESWYFGDWEAVRAVFPKVPAALTSKAKYRDPDAIKGGTWEAFERVLQEYGYFKSGLRKIEAARDIGPRMVPERNRSNSFAALRNVLVEISTREKDRKKKNGDSRRQKKFL